MKRLLSPRYQPPQPDRDDSWGALAAFFALVTAAITPKAITEHRAQTRILRAALQSQPASQGALSHASTQGELSLEESGTLSIEEL